MARGTNFSRVCVGRFEKQGEGRENRPRSRHCNRLKFQAGRKSGTYPNWWKLTLFARESVARRLALFARLFYWEKTYARWTTTFLRDLFLGVLRRDAGGRCQAASSAGVQARHEICDGRNWAAHDDSVFSAAHCDAGAGFDGNGVRAWHGR